MGKQVKTNVVRILDSNKISYELINYESDGFLDGVAIANKLNQSVDETFKTLVTKGKSGGYFVFVIPVHKELDLKAAAKAVSEKAVEMIPVADINKVTGYIRGGCSPIGMKKKFPTYIHESAKNFDTIAVSGGMRGLQIILSPVTLAEFVSAEFTDLIAEG